MWKTDDQQDANIGCATWSDAHGELQFDARGGQHGITAGNANDTRFAIAPVGEDKLPTAGEQFVRGDQWHINYPQADSSYALRIVLDIIESTPSTLVMECCLSVQTDLLDSHPKLDVECACHDIDSIVPSDPYGKDDVTGSGTAPISTAVGTSTTSILLPPEDHPFTTNHSTDMLLRLRLFGDFLEKGVIRRARPWIVIDRSQRSTNESLEALWQQLCDSPIPLT
ncbi:hypothetical protein Pla22_43630 [Rubripirellula amarantea]|uniref:Uncharacterized protein n=1 Tax=Rubripirellula amarantea TaxID=2527999 RepID=A0A5C5WGD3_9BACT|nr:hypothetical protein [Rubripirellula amarantea]TWT49171.1 hypothetical protein Pla22_43630 [Rubripirellula amarantea]